MRPIALFASFLILIGALFFLWQHRFEQVPDLPIWRLADLQASHPKVQGVEWTGSREDLKVRLRVGPGAPQIALRLALPGAPALDFFHFRYRTAARGLTPGPEKWHDGRFMVEWHAADGGSICEINSLSSNAYDGQSDLLNVVASPRCGKAIPVLRLEHLGQSGEFELSALEIVGVQERLSWKLSRWFLPLAWFAWAVAFVQSWPGEAFHRAGSAAGVWVVMGIYCAVPGPWKISRPMGDDFAMEAVPTRIASSPGDLVSELLSSDAIPSVGKLPDQGDWILRMKHQFANARPLLHVLLLFGPTLWMAFWVGRRPALFLMIHMALAIELAQVVFGYGFGADDVGDLLSDSVGILLALWTLCRFQKGRRVSPDGHQAA